jgi:hypothetical protein
MATTNTHWKQNMSRSNWDESCWQLCGEMDTRQCMRGDGQSRGCELL